MKKVLAGFLAILCLVGVAGCQKVNNESPKENEKVVYKEGVWEATAIDNYNNEENIASAKVTVDVTGQIVAVYLDTTYRGTTKKALGDDYNMKTYNPNAAGEWYQQVEALETAIVEHQGIDFLTVDKDGYVDSVAGCTIKVDALLNAVSNALKQAK